MAILVSGGTVCGFSYQLKGQEVDTCVRWEQEVPPVLHEVIVSSCHCQVEDKKYLPRITRGTGSGHPCQVG